MSKVAVGALFVLRIAGVLALVLGLAFWSGNLLQLQRVHMALGLLAVLTLWTLSGYGFARTELRGWSAALVVLGLAVVALGVTQTGLLPGESHWVVRVIHLLLGVGAVAQGDRLARRLRGAGQRSAAQGQPAMG
jgi:hypothetical protein